MSLDTRIRQAWLDLGTLNAVVRFDMTGMVQGSVSVATPNGLGAAVLEVKKSYDGGITFVSFSPAKTLTTTAPVEEVNSYATPMWVVQVTTAGTAGEQALVTLYATADPGQGVAS